MGWLDSLGLGAASSVLGDVTNWVTDTIGLSRHSRDQMYNEELQKELLSLQNQYYNENWDKQFKATNTEFDRRYNQYESAVARTKDLAKAGFSPAALMQNGNTGFGGVSPAGNAILPSVPHSAVPSMPLPSQSGFSDNLDAISKMKLSEAQSEEIFQLLKGRLRAQDDEHRLQTSLAVAREFENGLNKLYGSDERAQHLNNMVYEGLLLYLRGDESAANKKLLEAKIDLSKDEHQKNSIEIKNLQRYLDAIILKYGRESQYYSAAAGYQNALKMSEDEFRSFRKRLYEFQGDILQLEKGRETELYRDKINAQRKELEALGLLPDKVKQEIEHAEKENDWFYIGKILGVAADAAQTYVQYRNGQGIVNQMDVRNQIERDVFEYKKHNNVRETHEQHFDKDGNFTGEKKVYVTDRPVIWH